MNRPSLFWFASTRRAWLLLLSLTATLAGLPALLNAQPVTVIPPELAAPPGSVSTDDPGFLVNVHQLPDGVQRDPRDQLSEVERQLEGDIINPSTGEPYPNSVEDLPGTNGDDIYMQTEDESLWIVPEVINFSQDADPLFGGVGNEGHFTPDRKFPGIPNTTGNSQDASPVGTDDYAFEAFAFLELSAGLHTLVVRSNDGFLLTFGVGTNPDDIFAFQPEGAIWDGPRSAADSEFTVEIQEAGFYPIRLVYWEGQGDASLEFFSLDANDNRVLINDPENASAIKAYRTATQTTPSVLSVSPSPGTDNVLPQPVLRVEIENGDVTVDNESIQLSLDGESVPVEVEQSDGIVIGSFVSEELLTAGSTHEASLEFTDSEGNTRSHSWSFNIGDFTVIPPEFAYPVDAKDTDAPGFAGRVHQARNLAGLEATVPRAEAQIRGVLLDPISGEPLANEASPTEFTVTDVVNFEEEQRENGQFSSANGFPDALFPGIPGTGGHDNQFAVELVTFLELQAGTHVLGVTSQDGYELSTGPDARDVFGTITLGSDEGTKANPIDHSTIFVVEQDGLYPFRLLHFESHDDPIVNFTIPTDGAALEFYSIDVLEFAANPGSAERILVNDTSNANAVAAWQQVTGEARPYVKSVSPAPDSSSVRTTTSIEAVIANLDAGAEVSLEVNGETVEPDVTTSGEETTVSYTPDTPFERNTTVTVGLTYGETSNEWNFTTSSGDLVILITNVGEQQSDVQIRQHLEQVFGFDVLVLDDDTVDSQGGAASFTIDDANELEARLVYVASPVNSNKAGSQPWHTSGIPLVNVEQADVDNFQYGSSGGGINNSGLTDIEILLPEHPMAAGFPAGAVTFADFSDPSSQTGLHWAGLGSLAAGSEVVAQVPDNPDQAALVAIEKETTLSDGSTNPARIAHLGITGDDQFRSFTTEGLQLFNAVIAWAMEIEPPATESGTFDSIILNNQGEVEISWSGAGELYEAINVEGPYVRSSDQSNPQTRTPSQDQMFFQLRN